MPGLLISYVKPDVTFSRATKYRLKIASHCAKKHLWPIYISALWIFRKSVNAFNHESFFFSFWSQSFCCDSKAQVYCFSYNVDFSTHHNGNINMSKAFILFVNLRNSCKSQEVRCHETRITWHRSNGLQINTPVNQQPKLFPLLPSSEGRLPLPLVLALLSSPNYLAVLNVHTR